MRLRVQYTAQLRTVSGRAEDEVEVPEGSSLAELLLRVASELPCEAQATPVSTGDVIMLMPPGEPPTGRLLNFDLRSMTFTTMAIARRQDCAVCGLLPRATIDYTAARSTR